MFVLPERKFSITTPTGVEYEASICGGHLQIFRKVDGVWKEALYQSCYPTSTMITLDSVARYIEIWEAKLSDDEEEDYYRGKYELWELVYRNTEFWGINGKSAPESYFEKYPKDWVGREVYCKANNCFNLLTGSIEDFFSERVTITSKPFIEDGKEYVIIMNRNAPYKMLNEYWITFPEMYDDEKYQLIKGK